MGFERSKVEDGKFLGGSKVSGDLILEASEAAVTHLLPADFLYGTNKHCAKSPGSESRYLFSLRKKA